MAIVIGLLFDIIGRKKPYIVALVLALVAYGLFPFCKSVIFYYFLGAILKPLYSFVTIPFVPDLI